MPSTKTTAITALTLSLAALVVAVTNASFEQHNLLKHTASILTPTKTFAYSRTESDTTDVNTATAFWLNQEALGYHYYTHPETGLTFSYHQDFQIMTGSESGGDSIFVENPEHAMAFQIFIQPFDEPGPLIPERIRRDIPHFAMEHIIESELASGIPLIRFITSDETAGTLAEAWFTHNGHLFQIAMHAPGDDPEQLLLPWFRGFLQSLTFTTP